MNTEEEEEEEGTRCSRQMATLYEVTFWLFFFN
jgi:hypothetical protein